MIKAEPDIIAQCIALFGRWIQTLITAPYGRTTPRPSIILALVDLKLWYGGASHPMIHSKSMPSQANIAPSMEITYGNGRYYSAKIKRWVKSTAN